MVSSCLLEHSKKRPTCAQESVEIPRGQKNLSAPSFNGNHLEIFSYLQSLAGYLHPLLKSSAKMSSFPSPHLPGNEETNKWTKLWNCAMDVDFTQDKEIMRMPIVQHFLLMTYPPLFFFFLFIADNICLFFNCVFKIATGRDFYNVSRLAMNSNLYILYLCGLIERYPPPWMDPLSLWPKDCYKEWTAYLFFQCHHLNYLCNLFVENNSHYCTICNYSDEKEYINKVKQRIYVKRSVFVIILVRLLWQILSPVGPCPHAKSDPQWALCKQYSAIRK